MDSTLKPKQTDDPHDVLVVAPDAEHEQPHRNGGAPPWLVMGSANDHATW